MPGYESKAAKWAAAWARFCRIFTVMSYPCSKPHFIAKALEDRAAVSWEGEVASSTQSADRAVDAALRSVPLPDGLLTRLGMLVYTMPDEAADHVDYLGC
jgi:hypothetical protein